MKDMWTCVFHNIINSESYVREIPSPFFDQLTDDEESHRHFMQDNAMAHNAINSITALHISLWQMSVKSRTVASTITQFKFLCFSSAMHAGRKSVCEKSTLFESSSQK
jgi:hypothetical protein